MSDLNVGDKIEIVYHTNSAYTGKRGKVMYIGNSLKSGTNMLEDNLGTPEADPRLIVALEDSTIIHDIRDMQLRKL